MGSAFFVAIAAVVGLSLQTGSKPQERAAAEQESALQRSKALTRKVARKDNPGCGRLRAQLEDFLEVEGLVLPKVCNADGKTPSGTPKDISDRISNLRFVVAFLPDPVHTHLSALFDQFAVAIQEGAQDERYDFDGSWLPWNDQETSYPLLADQEASSRETESRESQPGIILFRKVSECSGGPSDATSNCREQWEPGGLLRSYQAGLVVFVVGEDATHGVHKEQFRNALAWVRTLQQATRTGGKPLAILGPTFSGSLPSLAQALAEPEVVDELDLRNTMSSEPLAVYSGSISGDAAAQVFRDSLGVHVKFHSFVQSDDEILRRFCAYITTEQPGFDSSRFAIVSEDETAYGRAENNDKGYPPEKKRDLCETEALQLFYPRDISALRGAYQVRSLFDGGAATQSTDPQRRNLPTDLADPAGNVHDSIRTYGGNQTPLGQEAFLQEIVSALRELHAQYVLLRSSNTLDQVFLTDFLRRSYPDGRIVILGSDLMFVRERGATGLSGTMTLSTYPLFPLERDWTEHQAVPASDRVFSSDTTEGTYIALRLLLNNKSLSRGDAVHRGCHVAENGDSGKTIFVPAIVCDSSTPIPDYSPPFWMLSAQCGEMLKDNNGEQCPYPGPATWLSVIGANRFWPMAALTKMTPLPVSADSRITDRANGRDAEPGGRPEMPVEMKLFLLALAGFSVFHFYCCASGSYTAKPAFRAHFASTGDLRHRALVLIGSSTVAFMGIGVGWGCGVFYASPPGLSYPWLALYCTTLVVFLAWLSVLAGGWKARRLSQDIPEGAKLERMRGREFKRWMYLGSALFISATALFYALSIAPIERMLLAENRVLTYWRAMHLVSGLSPIGPILAALVGIYLAFWFTLHGLALFGPDRPCLPPRLSLAWKMGSGKDKEFLKMFSQEDAASSIEQTATPLSWRVVAVSLGLFVLFLFLSLRLARGVPVRSLGAERYSLIFLLWLDLSCSLSIAEAWRLFSAWNQLKRLLTFLDRLPLRRTLAVLRGFSWGSVWKMSGNVLEVRYKVISRQMECMNHLLEAVGKPPKSTSNSGLRKARAALLWLRRSSLKFAEWYSKEYLNPSAGDLTAFATFQGKVAGTSGTLLTELLVPAWREEKESLLLVVSSDENEKTGFNSPPPPKNERVRHAEEFVCLNYLAFIQNVLGRMRTMTLTILVLFLASAAAMSVYPFDPRQGLSVVLIVLFVVLGGVIVKVYAEMHRDSTLSHVTNTKPGELGPEFWLKIVGLGFAPAVGVLARVFPSISDFVFGWLQPGISSLK